MLPERVHHRFQVAHADTHKLKNTDKQTNTHTATTKEGRFFAEEMRYTGIPNLELPFLFFG